MMKVFNKNVNMYNIIFSIIITLSIVGFIRIRTRKCEIRRRFNFIWKTTYRGWGKTWLIDTWRIDSIIRLCKSL